MNKVYLTKFNQEYIDSIINSGFAEFGMDKTLSEISSVFIKPNLVSDNKEYIDQGANTDIRIIEGVLKYLSKFKNLKIYLGESETGTKVKGRKLSKALDLMGVNMLHDKYEFQTINLTYDEKIIVKIPEAMILSQVEMGKSIMSSDLIINLPKIKTHKYSTITCALKNMFGAIPDPLRITYHENIHQVLADLYRLWGNKMFIITDGIVAMEGSGPLYGTRVNLGVIYFAQNPIYNDVVAAKIMSIPTREIKHIQLANDNERFDLENIEISGDVRIDEIRKKFQRANRNLFVRIEGKLMQHRWIVKILFNDWLRKNVTYRFNSILVKLRGGSFSWYIDGNDNEGGK